jgi:hypothetical protein
MRSLRDAGERRIRASDVRKAGMQHFNPPANLVFWHQYVTIDDRRMEVCRKFGLTGECRTGDSCPRAHKCVRCLGNGHSVLSCTVDSSDEDTFPTPWERGIKGAVAPEYQDD